MKGLVINYNGEEKSIAIKDGTVNIHLFDNNGDSRIHIEAVDYKECKNVIWCDFFHIKTGDKFKIRMAEIDHPSAPTKIIEDKNIKRPKTKLEFFYELETELKQQGLL